MKQFSSGLRVMVTDKEHELCGVKGTVTRIRTDGAAWVSMDEQPVAAERLFPFRHDKGDPRQHNAMLWPDECAKA